MYIPSEVLVIVRLKSEFEGLKDQLVDPLSPLNEHLSGYSAKERDDIKKEYLKALNEGNILKSFVESFPREPTDLPAIVVEESSQEEVEQYLGMMGDVEELEGKRTEVFRQTFSFRKTLGIEIVTQNKDVTKHLTVLIRFILLLSRIFFDTQNIRKQRINQVNALTRELPHYPEEAFTRTIFFSYEEDEDIKTLTEVPDITEIDVREAV